MWVLYFPSIAFKRTCISLRIDTNVHFQRYIFRGDIVKLVGFSRNSWHFAQFWKLNIQIADKLKIAFKKLFNIIIEGIKALSMHNLLNLILQLEINKCRKFEKNNFCKTPKLQIALYTRRRPVYSFFPN